MQIEDKGVPIATAGKVQEKAGRRLHQWCVWWEGLPDPHGWRRVFEQSNEYISALEHWWSTGVQIFQPFTVSSVFSDKWAATTFEILVLRQEFTDYDVDDSNIIIMCIGSPKSTLSWLGCGALINLLPCFNTFDLFWSGASYSKLKVFINIHSIALLVLLLALDTLLAKKLRPHYTAVIISDTSEVLQKPN